jgi:hypothetical protein
MSWSYDNQLSGKIMEDIVSVMLQESGYMVLPYGYEKTFPSLCKKLNKKIYPSTTLDRLSNSPDFLVYDDSDMTKLVEVKSHIQKGEKFWIKNIKIQEYNKFWSDAILVEIIPKGEVFYAEYIAKLASLNKPEEDVDVFIRENFRPFDKILDIIIPFKIFKKYKKKTLLIMDALRQS